MKAKVPYQMTAKQRQAMNEEIRRQIDAELKVDGNEYDAAILWALHLCFGFGAKRLRRFYNFFCKLYNNSGRWKFGRDEKELLKGIGVDVEEWYREVESCEH